MITVRLFGGAKKIFAGYSPRTEAGLTIGQLLDDMAQSLPPESPPPDTQNLLVAVNGVDSSALNGRSTLLRDGDTVSIIPVIHGGADALQFEVCGYGVLAFCAPAGPAFLDEMRLKYPLLRIQAISPDFVLNESHLRRILEISVSSEGRGALLAERLETDLLLRLTGTSQISRAIRLAAVDAGDTAMIICIGERDLLPPVCDGVGRGAMRFCGDAGRLLKHFGIGQSHLDAGYGAEDMLVECASILS